MRTHAVIQHHQGYQVKKTIKIISIALGASLIILTLLATYVAVTFDPNDYRETISSQVKAETGRILSLDDDLELQLFPWIGVKLGAVRLSGPPNFGDAPFIAIHSASIKARLLPLLQQRIEVDTIILDGLVANLITNANGDNNWDFSQTDAQSATAPEQGSNLSERPKTSSAILANLAINGIDISNATLIWSDAQNQNDIKLESFSLKTSAIKPNNPIAIKLETTVSGSPLPGQSLNLTLSTHLTISDDIQSLKLDQLHIQSGDLQLSALIEVEANLASNQFSGQIALTPFNPKPLLGQLAIKLPTMSDPAALSKISADISLTGDPSQISINKLAIKLDDTSVTGTAKHQLKPNSFSTFTLAIDQLDLDRYLAPASDQSPTKQSNSATNTATTTLDLPLDALRSLDLNGQLDIGALTVAGLHTKNITTRLSAAKGLIQLAPVEAELYQGKTKGQLQLDARSAQPDFSIKQQLTGFQAKPFMHDLLDSELVSGQANLDLALRTQGNTIDHLISNLNGNTQFTFTDGAIKGINVADRVRQAQAKLEKRAVPDQALQQTDFTTLSANIIFTNGVASNDDLKAMAPFLRLGGKGSANLNTMTMDYHLSATIVKEDKGQGGSDLDALRGKTIPIRIQGPLSQPAIKLDSSVIKNQIKEKAQQKITDQVEQKTEAIKSQVQEKAKDAVNDKLKQKLKQLF